MSFEEFYDKFLNMTKEFGYYNTPQRKDLLKILFTCKENLSADEIYQKIKKEHNIRVSLPTVYNLLGFLEELNLISIIVLPPYKTKKYKLNVHHSSHLVCNSCGKIIEFFDSFIEEKQRQILQNHNFTPTNHNIILYGICKNCQKQKS